MNRIGNVIISVFDKTGLPEFVSELNKMGVRFFSTGGTHKLICGLGIEAVKIEDYTGFPEMMDGRIKSMHPKIHGGILACRNDQAHMKSAQEQGIVMFDMVVVNLYPFKSTVEKGGAMHEIIENIDIGGPTLIRSAAKNFNDVAVVTNPADYTSIIEELKGNNGILSKTTLFNLCVKAFSHTAMYDGYISSYFSTIDNEGRKTSDDPEILTLQYIKKETLRYGENPHQKATVYRDINLLKGTAVAAEQLHGKQLSFNNYMDLESSKNIVSDFNEPAVAIVKHTNPCGAATGLDLPEAYKKALECDPVSAFGSIIAVNRRLDPVTAAMISELFVEAVIAPSYDPESLEIIKKKKNIRILEAGTFTRNAEMDCEFKKISGGLLIEDADRKIITVSDLQFVTEKHPSEEEIKELLFAQNLVKHVKSNAILLARNGATVGIGAGQMSRIDALEIAIKKANSSVEGCVLASDAFFPFRDCVDLAAKHGITAIIQPGGSVRDSDSIDACNELGIAMVFTGARSFRHL